MSNLFENARELPLLGAHPVAPDSGNYLLYRLTGDNREYIQYDDARKEYFRPREKTFNFVNTGIDNRDWLSICHNTLQSRRTPMIIPWAKARVREVVMSMRDNMTAGNTIQLIMYEDSINNNGFVANTDPQTFSFDTTDLFVTSWANNKRFSADLTGQNIILDRTMRYAMEYIKTGAGADPRDVYTYLVLEEVP